MFKKFRKLTSVLIAALMLSASFASLASVKAYAAPKATVYVALGDSVSYGMSAPAGHGYTDLMRDYLDGRNYRANTPTEYTNLSVPGFTAENLYSMVTDEDYAAIIAIADIITVNIGGNNLLQPVITLVQSVYPLATTMQELYIAINTDATPLYTLMGKLQIPTSAESIWLHTAFATGVTSFNLNWPQTIKEVRKLAPKAEIYVNTLYSPVPQGHPLSMLLDPYIQLINLSIGVQQYKSRYRVVDVYSAFAPNTTQVVGFNLSNYPFNVDIHPNTAGHQLIFETLKNKLMTTESRYYYE